MARTQIAAQVPVNINGTIGALAAALTFTTLDNVNNNYCIATGREIFIFQNTAAGAQTVTINSVPDQLGRSADITAYSIPAGPGTFAFFGPIPLSGWKQPGSPATLNFSASAATVSVAIVQLPATY